MMNLIKLLSSIVFIIIYLSCEHKPSNIVTHYFDSFDSVNKYLPLYGFYGHSSEDKKENLNWHKIYGMSDPIESRFFQFSLDNSRFVLTMTQFRYKNAREYTKDNFKTLFPPKLISYSSDKEPDIKTKNVEDTIVFKNNYTVLSGQYQTGAYYIGDSAICIDMLFIIEEAIKATSTKDVLNHLSLLDTFTIVRIAKTSHSDTFKEDSSADTNAVPMDEESSLLDRGNQ